MRADPASFPLCRVSGRAVGRVRPRPPARSPRRRARRTEAFRGKQREPGRAGRGGPSAGLDKGGRDPCSPRRDVDPGPHHRRLPDAHHRGRFPQSHHRGAARAGVGAVRRAARVPAPVLPGQAGEEPRGRGRGSGRAAGGAQDAGPGPAAVRPAGRKAGVQGPGNLAVLGRGTAATGVACEVPGCLSSRAWGEGVIGAGKDSGLGGAAVPARRRDELALLATLACFAPLPRAPRCGMKSEAPSPLLPHWKDWNTLKMRRGHICLRPGLWEGCL